MDWLVKCHATYYIRREAIYMHIIMFVRCDIKIPYGANFDGDESGLGKF